MLPIFKLLLNLFFPAKCIVCNKELHINEKHLCLNCYASIPFTYFWKIKDNPAQIRLWGRTYVKQVIPLFYYINDYRNMIHSLKYYNNISIGMYLGELLIRKIIDYIEQPDYIIPIPLHKLKKRKRGYNQAEIIGKGIVQYYKKNNLKAPKMLTDLIIRQKITQTQTKKGKIERWDNVRNAFKINRHKNIDKECTLLLIDDVMTTGATLDACASILKEHINCKIYIAVLGYVE